MSGLSRYKLGIDIGGTFTDMVLLDEALGTVRLAKTLTTPSDPLIGLFNGIDQVRQRYGVSPMEMDLLVHGTTLATNAVVERKGAKTALVTTAGFRDVLEIGREIRYNLYDIFIEMPQPLVPRHLRFEVEERMSCYGEVLSTPDEADLAQLATELVRQGVEAVAVCFLHSFTNPAHERQVAEFLRSRCPELTISISAEVLAEIREYERSSTTVINSYVQPLVTRYMGNLLDRLSAAGIRCNVRIIQSDGHVTTPKEAARQPVQLLESGPAGGAMVVSYYSKHMNAPDLLAFDMGGTTAKICIVSNGQPRITTDFEVARMRRFEKGSGLPVRVPAVDLIEIGAGGGSIARVDNLGLLRVGPHSAGASPGPACYGLGSPSPTVTDACLVLGYLDPHYFLGGTMLLDLEAAWQAILTEIATPLGLTVPEAAAAIYKTVCENMANAARVHILEKGYDPTRFGLFATGGAGPLHAAQVGSRLNSSRVIAPLGAGAASALGFLVAPISTRSVRSIPGTLGQTNWQEVNNAFKEMEASGLEMMSMSGISAPEVTTMRLADMRYRGQGHEITVLVPAGDLGAEQSALLFSAFSDAYSSHYGRLVPNVDVEVINWRIGMSAAPGLPPGRISILTGEDGEAIVKGERSVYDLQLKQYNQVPVYNRYRMPAGYTIEAPAIIEERELTLVVPRGWHATIDQQQNAVLSPGGV